MKEKYQHLKFSVSPLTGRIQLGRISKCGKYFLDGATDKTNEVFEAVVQMVENTENNTITVTDKRSGEKVTVVVKREKSENN